MQVAVPPKSEEECRAFYVRVLGMAELAKPLALAGRGGIWVAAGGEQLHCGVESDFKPARKAHPAFAVEHLHDLAARIRAAGYEVAWDETNPSVRRFFTHDPFGNRLEFVESKAD
ncbi:MAG TPA: VOC family protein [Xanthobacteraceae bacterium]|nr:VOC family protein [Xanthobacteraceae bacterium]